MIVSVGLFFLVAASCTYAVDDTEFGYAVDFSNVATVGDYKKLIAANYTVAFVRVYRPDGDGMADTNGCINILNGVRANMKMEAYITPRWNSKNGGPDYTATETYQMLTNCGIQKIRSVWIQVVDPDQWGTNQQGNVDSITAFTDAFQALSPDTFFGIYTNTKDWANITGNSTDFPGGFMLWYSDVTAGGIDGEGVDSMKYYVKQTLAPWTQPSVKQFAQNEQLSGITVKPLNRNVYKYDDDTMGDGQLMRSPPVMRNPVNGRTPLMSVGGHFHLRK